MGPQAHAAILRCVITHRRLRRVSLTVTSAATLVLAAGSLVPAVADTPAGWDEGPGPSALDYLVVLLLIPVGLALVISFLALVPSLVRGRGYEPGQAWRGRSEWFGGPEKGVQAADEVDPERLEAGGKGAGGGSGRW